MIRRVLIVDDEPIVVDGLLNLIETESIPDLLVIPSASPAAAMAQMQRTRIDVLIADIEMPGLSGFTLQEELHRLWPRAHTIFLTAHDRFDYLRAAVRRERVDYVLKTEDDRVILDSLKRALWSVDREVREPVVTTEAEMTLKRHRNAVVESLLKQLIHGGEDADGLQADASAVKLRIDPERPVFPVLTRRLTPALGSADASSVQTHGNLLHVVASNHLEPRLSFEGVTWSENEYLILVQSGGEEDEPTLRAIREELDVVQQQCMDFGGVSVAAAVYRRPRDIGACAPAVHRMTAALNAGSNDGTVPILTCDEEDTGGGSATGIPSTVVAAEHLIQTRLDRQLSLAAVADELEINASYLSRLYRRYRGRPLVQFLSDVRVQRAKEILESTDFKLAAVASMVGLSTPSYFTAFFKRHTGMTPHEYRSRYRDSALTDDRQEIVSST